ncbi:MAG: RNA polymerase sigma factor [Labilithrix sp.]
MTALRLVKNGDALDDRDDDALMLLAAAGRRDAFRVLVERHARRVFRFCLRLTNDRRVAEELAQETWLAAWNARETYQPEGQFAIWLLVAARNRCLNAKRGQTRRERVMVTDNEADAAESAKQLDRIIATEERRRVHDALAELPAPMREAVTLRYAESLAYEQIASVVGANESTVRSRVFHGVKKLHQLLTGGAS